MDRETAVRMWREAVGEHAIGLPPTDMMLENFARMVEAAERDRSAKLCYEHAADIELDGEWDRRSSETVREKALTALVLGDRIGATIRPNFEANRPKTAREEL